MTAILETRRLILRRFHDSDLLGIVAALNNRRITVNTGSIPWPYTLDDNHAFRRLPMDERRTSRLVIVPKDGDGCAIGGIGYEADASKPCAEIGYWLAESAWAKGYGFEAAEAVTEHAFKAAGNAYLVAGYVKGNEASRRILDRLGFRVTGHMLSYSKGAARLQPVTRLELTRREWLKQTDRGR